MKEEKQKVGLLIQDRFLRFIYQGLFQTNCFSTVDISNSRTMRNIFENTCLSLMIFGMFLKERDVRAVVYKVLLDKIPVLILEIDETRGLLEDFLKHDQYTYVDILNDELKDVVKKANKLMSKYRVRC